MLGHSFPFAEVTPLKTSLFDYRMQRKGKEGARKSGRVSRTLQRNQILEIKHTPSYLADLAQEKSGQMNQSIVALFDSAVIFSPNVLDFFLQKKLKRS